MMTYTVVTPESAEAGDIAETGWRVGGFDYPLQDEEGFHEEVLSGVCKDPDSYSVADTVGELLALAVEHGCTFTGSDRTATGEPFLDDHTTGEERSYSLHIEKVTDATLARIARLVNARVGGLA